MMKAVSVATLLLLAISVIVFWNIEQNKKAAEQSWAKIAKQKEKWLAVKAKIDAANAVAKYEAEAKAKAEEKIKLAIVRKVEGVEHPLIRQLVDEPEYWGFIGDTSRKAKVQKWAGRKAHILASNAGFVDLLRGAEIRVARPDTVAYVLVKTNGKISIQVFLKDKNGNYQVSQKKSEEVASKQPVPQRVLQVAETYSADNFIGLPGSESFQPPYEYLWIGFNPTTVSMVR